MEVSKPIDLGFAQKCCIERIDVLFLQLLIKINDMLELIEEPTVNLGQFVNLVYVVLRQVHRLRDDKDTLVRRLTQRCIDIWNLQLLVLHKSMHPLSNHAKSFLDSFLEVTSYSHYLTH